MSQGDDLLSRIQATHPDLHAEDAFVMPLWFREQKSWVQDPINSDNAVYNYPLAIRVRGPLKGEVLRESLQQIVRRHTVLRSVFRVVDDDLVQVITPAPPIKIPIIDLNGSSNESVDDLEARTRHMAVHAAREPFDLSQGPLLRATLFRLDREDHILLLITHHLVYDDWSTGILMRELAELYSEGVAGTEVSLAKLPFTYGDFARWLRMQMQHKKLENRLDFWSRELAGGNDFHHLPTDNSRPKSRTYRGQCRSTTIPEDITHSLRILCQRERISLFMVLLGAFQCLLHNYSGDADIAVGSCAANRPLSQVEGLIGRFGNDVVLRTDMAGDPTFRELFARVRKTSLTAFSYQDLPFGQLVKTLARVETSRNPLFQVMFIMQDAPKGGGEFPGLAVSSFPLELETAKYDLNVWLRPLRGIEIVFEYNSDLFEPRTMEEMLHCYQQLLKLIAENPDAHISGSARPARPEYLALQVRGDCFAADAEDEVQAKLIDIWQKTLGRKPIGITDDYFQLGGTSLLAVRLFAQIEEVLRVKLPLSVLITAPTIKKLSPIIRNGETDGT